MPPLAPDPIAPDAYDGFVWDHLRHVEGAVARIYADAKGIPTLATGLALAVRGRDGGWRLRPWAEIGGWISGDQARPHMFSLEEQRRLNRCVEAVAAGDPGRAHSLIPPFEPRIETAERNHFGFVLTEARMRALALMAWEPFCRAVRADLARHLGAKGAAAYARTRQEAGMASVRFNIGLGRETPKATRALAEGDRARLWFEIACNTNPPSNGAARAGIAGRRLAEADLACRPRSRWSEEERAELDRLLAQSPDHVPLPPDQE